MFAHRGGRALGPENTMPAFDCGLASGADGLELDVHLSSDGEVVVCHDPTLDRTTDATGPVAARTAAELARGQRDRAASASISSTRGRARAPASRRCATSWRDTRTRA